MVIVRVVQPSHVVLMSLADDEIDYSNCSRITNERLSSETILRFYDHLLLSMSRRRVGPTVVGVAVVYPSLFYCVCSSY